jgi:hypothetical protein
MVQVFLLRVGLQRCRKSVQVLFHRPFTGMYLHPTNQRMDSRSVVELFNVAPQWIEGDFGAMWGCSMSFLVLSDSVVFTHLTYLCIYSFSMGFI